MGCRFESRFLCERNSSNRFEKVNRILGNRKSNHAKWRKKKYTVNTVLDYINVEGLEGYRKKVYPNLDGTFRTTDDAETFALKKTDDGWQMHYKNEGNAWTEQLIKLSDDHFEVKNTENITYTYKRWQEMELGVSR